MDTDSLYLALAVKELEDCIRPGMKTEWERMLSNGCTDSFTAGAVADFFPKKCYDMHKILKRENLDSSKRNSDAQRCYV